MSFWVKAFIAMWMAAHHLSLKIIKPLRGALQVNLKELIRFFKWDRRKRSIFKHQKSIPKQEPQVDGRLFWCSFTNNFIINFTL